jgi:SAM-dependent methyltransferase
VPKHVEQLRADATAHGLDIETAVGDARSLDFADAAADALLLGPLYHQPVRGDRLRALREAARVVKPGGPVFAAAISRWAPRLDGEVVERLDLEHASIRDQIQTVERTGRLPPLFAGAFTGYCHRPAQLRAEIRAAGLDVLDLVGLEGIAFALSDLEARLADPRGRAVIMNAARELAVIPELRGISPHLLATARRPAQRS